MNLYQEMYYRLFNRITDMIEELQAIQQEAEEMYISYMEEELDREKLENFVPFPFDKLKNRL